jgi:hypothetical protein
MVGTVVIISKKVAEYGVKGMAIFRRNALKAWVAALEFSLTAEKRELKKARKKQKVVELKEENWGELAKIKMATATVKAKRAGRPRKRPNPKAPVKIKAVVKAKKSQRRVAKVKPVVSTKLKAKKSQRRVAKTKPAVSAKPKAKKSQRRIAKAKAAVSTELKAKTLQQQTKKAGAKAKVAVKSLERKLKVASAKPLSGRSGRPATPTELKTKIHRLEGELDDLKYPPVEMEDELFED